MLGNLLNYGIIASASLTHASLQSKLVYGQKAARINNKNHVCAYIIPVWRHIMVFTVNYKNYFSFKVSFKSFPALNLGALQAAILIVFPVCGFFPVLAALSTVSKVPKPTSWIFSSFFNSSVTVEINAFSASSASFLDSSDFSAIAETSSV